MTSGRPLVADTGAIYALYDADDDHHGAVAAAQEGERGPIVVPMAILGELDYLLREFLGVDAELDFLDSVLSGAFSLEPMTEPDLKRCRRSSPSTATSTLGWWTPPSWRPRSGSRPTAS